MTQHRLRPAEKPVTEKDLPVTKINDDKKYFEALETAEAG